MSKAKKTPKKPERSSKSPLKSPKKPERSSKSPLKSPKKPERSSKSTTKSPKKPERSSKSTTKSLKKPERSTKSSTKSLKKPERSSRSSKSPTKSLKNPERSSKSSKSPTKSLKNPERSSKSSKSLKNPERSSKSSKSPTKSLKNPERSSTRSPAKHERSPSRRILPATPKMLTTDRMNFIRGMVGTRVSKPSEEEDKDYRAQFGSGGQAIRFYDDSPDNIADVRKDEKIECIHVARTNRTVPKGSADGGSGRAYLDFVKSKGGWDLHGQDHDLLDVLRYYKDHSYDEEDTSDSLTEPMMRDLRTWAQTNRNARAVFFDFDRVINQVEGILSFDTVSDVRGAGLTVSGLVKYHVGTKSRLALFRRVLDELVRIGIKVHVVSNNEAAKTEFFVALLKGIHGVFSREVVHASMDYPTKLHCIRQKGLVR